MLSILQEHTHHCQVATIHAAANCRNPAHGTAWSKSNLIMAIIVTETISFILVALAMIVLVHYVEMWLALESQINVLPGEFIDKYSQRARHIKVHRKRHKTPENLFFDSRRDIYVIDKELARNKLSHIVIIIVLYTVIVILINVNNVSDVEF